MAKMGQRKVSETKKREGTGLTVPALGLNVVIPTVQVQTSAMVSVGSTLGIPIMREGFVTETGLLPSSPVSESRVLL